MELQVKAKAIRLGISRALCAINEENRLALKPAGLLTRDARMVEEKSQVREKSKKEIPILKTLIFFSRFIYKLLQKLPVMFSTQTLLPSNVKLIA